MRKKIVLIGSTGSVGLSALELIRRHPERFEVVGLAAGSNEAKIREQIEEFSPQFAFLASEAAAQRLRACAGDRVTILGGADTLRTAAAWPGADLILAASSGVSAFEAVLEALRMGRQVAVANKELLVMAGRLVSEAALAGGGTVLPVDSEHNAIFQCLHPNRQATREVRRLILTSSGGPLRTVPKENFVALTQEQVLKHPKWNMGAKITVDSATMMNKGLEMIEAMWLFGVGSAQIEVVVHPEAIVHSMVEFIDGSVIAQMGITDMQLPLIHCLGYPERISDSRLWVEPADFGKLTFERPDFSKFDCLRMARDIAREGDTTLPCVLNAADEIAVQFFLEKEIGFTQISEVIERCVGEHSAQVRPDLETILETDVRARERARYWCETLSRRVASKGY